MVHFFFVFRSTAVYSKKDLVSVDAETVEADSSTKKKLSLKRLARQQSLMETQMSADGAMHVTYWF